MSVDKLNSGEGNSENLNDNLKKVIERKKVEIATRTNVVLAKGESLENVDSYRFESLDTQTLSPEQIKEVSDFFRFTFNNAFPEYAVCTDCETSVSALDVFGSQGEYIELEELDKECNLPYCVDCGEKMELFHDANMTFDKLTEKFEQEGTIVLFRSDEDESIKGMTFGYYDSLEGVIDKEWGHPYNYMKKESQDVALKFDAEGAIEKISVDVGGGIEPESRVYCFNCIILDHTVRNCLSELTSRLLRNVQKNGNVDVPVLGQALSKGVVKLWMMRNGYHEVEEIFGEDYALMVGRLKDVCDIYLSTH